MFNEYLSKISTKSEKEFLMSFAIILKLLDSHSVTDFNIKFALFKILYSRSSLPCPSILDTALIFPI